MTTAEKNPIVIIHERSWRTPKLPAKYRYEYKTEINVEAGINSLTVSVVKHSLFVRFFLGRDRIVKSLTRNITNEGVVSTSITCTDMELELANEIFPSL